MRASTLIFVLMVLAAPGCRDEAHEAAAPGRPSVYTVNYPLQYFAERVGGGAVEVRFPAPADVDPACWTPDAETIVAYQNADLILLNGAAYAKWIAHATLPPSKLVDTSASFKDRYLKIEGTVSHAHGPGGAHAHGDTASTTWLDPALAVEQARAIRDAMAARWPDRAAAFAGRFDDLQADLLSLDPQIGEVDTHLVASHPVYQYLAGAYGLDMTSVQWEPDERPDEAMWARLEAILSRHPARFMIWEVEPLPETVERLRALGVDVIVVDPCGNVSAHGTFLDVMRANMTNLQRMEP